MRFDNKVCLVTGAASGIGKATAMRMAAEGGKVLIIDRDEKVGMATADLLTSQQQESFFKKADVSSEADIQDAVAFAVDKWKRIDVLVNNAGMMTFKPIIELSIQEWDLLMAVNLRAAFLFSKLSIPYMNEGAIVNTSSVHAHQSTPNVVPYASSKAALEAFTRGLSIEYPGKLRCNSVTVGAVDTPMLRNNPNVITGKEIIQGKIGRPEEIAAVICFLASDEASFVNGSTVVVDGGRLDIL